jgi:hypothetical protein
MAGNCKAWTVERNLKKLRMEKPGGQLNEIKLASTNYSNNGIVHIKSRGEGEQRYKYLQTYDFLVSYSRPNREKSKTLSSIPGTNRILTNI